MNPSGRDAVPQGRIRRTMPLAGFTARAAGGRMVAGLRERAGDAGAVDRFHEYTAARYADLLGHSKGVLMKAGQFFSMVDVTAAGGEQLSPYQNALSRLRADAPPMDPVLAHEVLCNDLGRPVDEVFAEFSDEPMAAASIGQVHRAMLRDGRPVAVKIQYPGAAQAIRDDLANTELLTSFFRFAASAAGGGMRADLRQMTQEISARILEEIDYRHEAANITRFGDLYRDHPFIRVPEVVDAASGDRVLTMTYLDGLSWADALRADQDLKDTWAEVILRFATGSYRHANVLHADPHPGNYCFGVDGTVGFVDFGCVKVMAERQRGNFIRMFRAFVEQRKSDLHQLMTESGFLTIDSDLTIDDVYQWWAGLCHELLVAQPATFGADTARRTTQGLIALSTDHPIRRMLVPDDFVFLNRLFLSVNAICGALNATVHVRALADDMDGVAEPITPLGKQHVAWVRQRGLPFGLEHHGHI
jgi:predicted unusual protein kinase regulating ubiquinone biosynthesis (AarF/ABC1/UbiB family)